MMQTRVLGKSALRVSEIGIGGWGIGGPDWNLNMEMGWSGTNDEESIDGLKRAFELGATHFDTADVYGHGHSERLIGTFLKHAPRTQVVIGTKVGYFRGCAPNAFHPLHMRHQLEMSLSNLETDYIDIYYLHNAYFGDNDEFFDDAVEAMNRFKEEGKIRVIGQRGPHAYAPHRINGSYQSNNKYDRFLKLASVVKPEVIQVRFNMITPTFDNPATNIFKWAEINNVGVVINKPLGQGLLLGKYDPNDPPVFGPGDHRQRKRWFSSDGLRILQKRLAPIKERFGASLPNLVRVALQYCLAHSQNGCVIVGFKNPSQVEVNLTAAGRPLTKEDVQFIKTVMAGISDEVGSFFREVVQSE